MTQRAAQHSDPADHGFGDDISPENGPLAFAALLGLICVILKLKCASRLTVSDSLLSMSVTKVSVAILWAVSSKSWC